MLGTSVARRAIGTLPKDGQSLLTFRFGTNRIETNFTRAQVRTLVNNNASLTNFG